MVGAKEPLQVEILELLLAVVLKQGGVVELSYDEIEAARGHRLDGDPDNARRVFTLRVSDAEGNTE
jgi:hypothetical protein